MDEFDDFYREDEWDDPNLSLPSYFITCFDIEKLELYQEVIRVFAANNPEHGLDIDTTGTWNPCRDPALLCYDRGNLNEFWQIFEALKNR